MKIESELKARPETKPGALVQDKYVIVLKSSNVTVEHVQKSLSKKSYFIGNPEQISSVKIIVERRFSHNLNQRGMKLPATYNYSSADTDIHSKLLILVEETMEVWNIEKTKLSTKQKTKKDTSRK